MAVGVKGARGHPLTAKCRIAATTVSVGGWRHSDLTRLTAPPARRASKPRPYFSRNVCGLIAPSRRHLLYQNLRAMSAGAVEPHVIFESHGERSRPEGYTDNAIAANAAATSLSTSSSDCIPTNFCKSANAAFSASILCSGSAILSAPSIAF